MFVVSIFAEQKGLMVRLVKESYYKFKSDDLPQMEKFGDFVEEFATNLAKSKGGVSFNKVDSIVSQITKKAFGTPWKFLDM